MEEVDTQATFILSNDSALIIDKVPVYDSGLQQ